MDISRVLEEYDAMYGVRPLAEIEGFLYNKIAEAVAERDESSIFTLLNEIIGFCRDTMQKEKGIAYSGSLLGLMQKMNLAGTPEYATALLNIANADRAFGRHEEAYAFFSETLSIYEKNYDRMDFAYANLFNNWSLLCQEMGDFQQAAQMLKRALEVVDSYPEAVIQQAVTRTNLAASLLEKKEASEALRYIREALDIFEAGGGVDFHYGAALVVMGDAKVKEAAYAEAAGWYQRGLLELQKHVGQNDNYLRVLEKYQNAVRQSGEKTIWKSNLERSREFYEKYGRQMIHENFPEYEARIAVGVVGEGSDCFGYDDYISSDHDYAPGFCMWLSEADDAQIGSRLQAAYDELVKKYGLYGNEETRLASRRKVNSINQFYKEILGVTADYEAVGQMVAAAARMNHAKGEGAPVGRAARIEEIKEMTEEFRLAHAGNGEIFRDDTGVFSAVRESLQTGYPETLRRRKLAEALHDFSQYAQSNYPRAMARKDQVTANLCVSKALETAMNLMYLLNRTYAPYYKWKKKGLEDLPRMQALIPLLEEAAQLPGQQAAWENVLFVSSRINLQDAFVVLFEKMAAEILAELKAQGLAEGETLFLEAYVGPLILSEP